MVRERLGDIDRAKGLAITLVVLGHLSFDAVPPGNEWYEHLNGLIYKFHMAFFMFLTGYVMFYTYPEMRTLKDYVGYAQKKFARIVPAYILLAVVIIAGKTVLGEFAELENPSVGARELIKAVVCPGESCCRYLWFVYTVFGYYVTIPLLLILFRQNLLALLTFAFVLYFLPRSEYLGHARICQYMFVFVLGGYALRHRALYLTVIDRYRNIFLAIFAGCMALYFVVDVPKLLFGIVAIPALHSLVRHRVISERMSVLAFIGRYTFPVYLFNVLVTGSLLLFLGRYWSLDGVHFRMVAPALFLSGLLVPIVGYELFIKRVPVLNRIVRV